MGREIQNKGAEKRPRGNPNWRRGGPSPNPGGRPKEEREVVEALRLHGDELVAALLKQARKGNVKAIEAALSRAYGKPKQVVEFVDPNNDPDRKWNFDRLTKEELNELTRLHTKATGCTSHAGGVVRVLEPAELAKYDVPEADSGVIYRQSTPRWKPQQPAQLEAGVPT